MASGSAASLLSNMVAETAALFEVAHQVEHLALALRSWLSGRSVDRGCSF